MNKKEIVFTMFLAIVAMGVMSACVQVVLHLLLFIFKLNQ